MGLLSLNSSMTCSGEHSCILMFMVLWSGAGRGRSTRGLEAPKICPREGFWRLSEELKLLPAPLGASADGPQLHH